MGCRFLRFLVVDVKYYQKSFAYSKSATGGQDLSTKSFDDFSTGGIEGEAENLENIVGRKKKEEGKTERGKSREEETMNQVVDGLVVLNRSSKKG